MHIITIFAVFGVKVRFMSLCLSLSTFNYSCRLFFSLEKWPEKSPLRPMKTTSVLAGHHFQLIPINNNARG